MRPVMPVNLREVRRFPRVSGDEPQTRSPGAAWVMFSPRERG